MLSKRIASLALVGALGVPVVGAVACDPCPTHPVWVVSTYVDSTGHLVTHGEWVNQPTGSGCWR